MKHLFLGDFKDFSNEELVEHIIKEYGVNSKELNQYDILIAYEDEGEWEGYSWFFIQDKNGNVYEVEGSHCSCYGFEGQWEPMESSWKYLLDTGSDCAYDSKDINNFIIETAMKLPGSLGSYCKGYVEGCCSTEPNPNDAEDKEEYEKGWLAGAEIAEKAETDYFLSKLIMDRFEDFMFQGKFWNKKEDKQ